MVDHMAGIHVGQSFQRQPMPLSFLIDPCGKRLLHDPSAGTLKTLGKDVHLVGEPRWDMSRNNRVLAPMYLIPNRHDCKLIIVLTIRNIGRNRAGHSGEHCLQFLYMPANDRLHEACLQSFQIAKQQGLWDIPPMLCEQDRDQKGQWRNVEAFQTSQIVFQTNLWIAAFELPDPRRSEPGFSAQ